MPYTPQGIALQWRVTTDPDLGGLLFFVEAGSTFSADDYATAYGLDRGRITKADVHSINHLAARLREGQWLQVEHSLCHV